MRKNVNSSKFDPGKIVDNLNIIIIVNGTLLIGHVNVP